MFRDSEVEAQLNRILGSPAFVSSPRSRQFLEFCVYRTTRGDPSQLKETTIAVEVFQRSADYNPKIDPIVRVHAMRVRTKLELYYRDFGFDDPIRIDLPKGGYVALIMRTLPRRKTDFTDWTPPLAALDSFAGRLPENFSVPVAPHLAEDKPAVSTGLAPATTRLPRWYGWIIAFGALLLLGLLAAFVLSSRREPVKVAGGLRPLVPVDLGPERSSDFSWSPDGTRLAFTRRGNDNVPHIYLTDFEAGRSPAPLIAADTAGESRPAWSPDGRQIAFARRTDISHIEIFRYDILSGRQVLVGSFLHPAAVYEESPALDWSPNGRYLVTAEQITAGNPVRLVLVDLAMGTRSALTAPPTSSTGDLEARFSPDGQWVAFRRGGLGDLYLTSLKGEQAQPAVRLTLDNRGVRGITWADEGRSILFGTRGPNSATFGISRIARTGGPVQVLGPQGFDAVNPALSATGSLAMEHRELSSTLEEYSLKHAEQHAIPIDGVNVGSVAYTTDGRSLAYTSTRSGCMELWVMRHLEQGNWKAPEQITRFECRGIMLLPAWAPDGKSLAFSYRSDGKTNLFTYNLVQRKLKQITDTQNRDITPEYSGDGRYIYYSSNDDGTSRIWRLRTDGSSRPEPMFVEAVTSFVPSLDGKWLYFLREGNGLTLLRRNLEDGSTEEIFHTSGRATFINSLAQGGGQIFVSVSQTDATHSDVYEINPDTKSARLALHLAGLPPYSEYSLPAFSIVENGSRLIAPRTLVDKSMLYTSRVTN